MKKKPKQFLKTKRLSLECLLNEYNNDLFFLIVFIILTKTIGCKLLPAVNLLLKIQNFVCILKHYLLIEQLLQNGFK